MSNSFNAHKGKHLEKPDVNKLTSTTTTTTVSVSSTIVPSPQTFSQRTIISCIYSKSLLLLLQMLCHLTLTLSPPSLLLHRLLCQCDCYSACLYNICVILTCLPCSSRLPLKEIACITAEKARYQKSLAGYNAYFFPLISPGDGGERGKTANEQLFVWLLSCLLSLDKLVDELITVCVCMSACLCKCELWTQSAQSLAKCALHKN